MMLLLSTVPTKAAYTWWEDLWFYYCWLNTPSLDTPIFSSVYMVNFDLNEGELVGFAHESPNANGPVNVQSDDADYNNYYGSFQDALEHYGTDGYYPNYYTSYWPSQGNMKTTYNGGGSLHVVNGIFEYLSLAQQIFNGQDGMATYPVRRIGPRAFRWIAMPEDYTIPSFINYIGGNAFSKSAGILHLTFPANFTTKYGTRTMAPDEDLTDSPKWGGICEGMSSLKKVTFPGAPVIRICKSCSSLNEVELQTSCVIPQLAFADCPNLSDFDWEKVTGIERNAFLRSGISHADLTHIEPSTSYIGNSAFKDCKNLESVKFNAVCYFLKSVFQGCDVLHEIDCSEVATPPSANETTFDETTYENATLYVPAESYAAYRTHAVWGKFQNIVAGAPGTQISESDIEPLGNISSTCEQAFNTRYTHKANTRVELICNVQKNQAFRWEALLGGRLGSYQSNAFCFFARTDGNDIPCFNRTGNEPRGNGFVYDEDIRLVCEGNKAEWYRLGSDTPAGSVTTTGTVDDGKTPLFLFNLNTADAEGGLREDTSPCSMRLYSCKIYEGDILVRDFIPASYQNEPGLYDRLTQTFGGSISGVSFQGSMSTAIKNQPTAENTPATIWYGTDGRRLIGKPTQKGVYINDGKKLVVK